MYSLPLHLAKGITGGEGGRGGATVPEEGASEEEGGRPDQRSRLQGEVHNGQVSDHTTPLG